MAKKKLIKYTLKMDKEKKAKKIVEVKDSSKKKMKPEVVEKKFILFLDYDEHRSGGEPESDEKWCNRTDEHIQFTPVNLCRNDKLCRSWHREEIEVSEEDFNKEHLYMVLVRYESGDTFGRSYGEWCIVKVTGDSDIAVKSKTSIENGGSGGHEYKPWDGYFERLEGVSVELMHVIGNK